MAILYAYKKDNGALVLPTLIANQEVKELFFYNEWTIVAASKSVVFPTQNQLIKFRPVDGANFAEKLVDLLWKLRKVLKPAFDIIDGLVVDMIKNKYPIAVQVMLLAAGRDEDRTEYVDFVKECMAWGEKEKEKYSLTLDS